MPSHRVFALVVAIVAAPFALAGVAEANLLTNGSFETGDFSGWTQGGNLGDTFVNSGAFIPYAGAQDGLFYVLAGPIGSDGTLSQTFADIPGDTLHISGFYAAVGDSPSDLSVSFDATSLLSLTDPDTGAIYTQFNFDVTATGSDTFTLAFRDDPGFIALDNFMIADITSIPEPAPLMVLAAALLGLAAFKRRK